MSFGFNCETCSHVFDHCILPRSIPKAFGLSFVIVSLVNDIVFLDPHLGSSGALTVRRVALHDLEPCRLNDSNHRLRTSALVIVEKLR